MKVLIVLCCALVSFVSCTTREIAFVKLGTYKGKTAEDISYSKNYYFPKHYRGTWLMARLTCQSYNMELARFETQAEHHAVRALMKQNDAYLTEWNHVDGMSGIGPGIRDNDNEWYFGDGKKIPWAIDWNGGWSWFIESQKCLCLGKATGNFEDITCTNEFSDAGFICQEVTSFN